jgi:hypothetical protein
MVRAPFLHAVVVLGVNPKPASPVAIGRSSRTPVFDGLWRGLTPPLVDGAFAAKLFC